jgi:hypothetical protein
LLTLLDGTRDRARLVEDARAFIQTSPSGAASDVTPSGEELARNLENTLEVFARCALLQS